MEGALEDPSGAQAAADATFDALAALSAVTGVEGFPARSLAGPGDEVPSNPAEHWGWNDSPTLEGWRFLGNTSSDEIVGHVLAYSLYHDLVPPDSNSSYSSLGDRGGDSDRQQQAADLLSLKAATLHQWRWSGKGPKFTRLGSRTIRYTYQDLQDWIANSNRI